MTLRPSTAPQRVPLPSPPASSLLDGPGPQSDSLRATSPTVTRFQATAVTHPFLESSVVSALVAELVDFAAACRQDYVTCLVAESASTSVCPPSVGGKCALGTDVLEDRQEDLECFAAAVPHLVSMLLAPEGDHALTPLCRCSTLSSPPLDESVEPSGPCTGMLRRGCCATCAELRWLTYLLTDLGERPCSSPFLYVDNKAMIALCQEHRLEHRTKYIALRYFLARELQQRGQLRLAYVACQANTTDVFTKALQPCTYVDAVPPPRANIVDGMWLFKVKRPTGSPHVFKVRYLARGFSQHEGVDFLHTFAPTPKMITLRVLLHIAAQPDYELHSLNSSTAFLQGRLHEEIWMRRPPGFTDTFPPGPQWSLRRLVYGLRQSPRDWHDTIRSTLRNLGFRPSSADPSLFVRAGSTPFFILVYVDDLVFAIAYKESLAEFSTTQATPLAVDHQLTGPFPDEPFKSNGPYAELVGCLMYVMTCTRLDLAFPFSFLSRFVATGRHCPVHWTAAVRAKYSATTSGMGLLFGGTQLVVLTADDSSPSSILNRAGILWSLILDSSRQRTAQALYEAIIARYSSLATAALGHLLLQYMFPELSAFAIVEDLVSHLEGAAGTGGGGGAGAGDPTEARGAGAVGAGAGGTGVGCAGAGGAGAVDRGAGGAGGTVRPRTYFFPLLQQVLGVLPSTDLTPPLLCPPPDHSQPPLPPASLKPAPSP
ncbi:unnamed protein product [Closterium sp. NIES-54]